MEFNTRAVPLNKDTTDSEPKKIFASSRAFGQSSNLPFVTITCFYR